MSVIRWVHPSISSTITDNSIMFVTSQGTTKLFVVFTSERGIDNKIQLITSATEFVFFYGPPDMQHHGQVNYNIINWLNGGGGVYGLRVLPEDAGFSNAILNVQTKIGEKEVYNHNEELILVPDVTIRPTITYTNVNNTTQNTLEFDELRRSRAGTIDGYQNNMLFAVTPRGRGSGYNNMGFRLTLTDHLDNTFEFRIYNFEVTQVTVTGGIETIEGPFQVSFDPDALSHSGESMFIVDVIKTYSKFYDIIFNERQYESLGAIINPFVNPNRIDFLSGQTRVVNDENETAFNELTGQEEDVHFYLHHYDTTHQWTGNINIIDSLDAVEVSIVNLDNDYRTRVYRRAERTIERLRRALGLIRRINMPSNPFENWVKPLIRPNGRLDASLAQVDGLYETLMQRKDELRHSNPVPLVPGGPLVNQNPQQRRNNLRTAATATRNGINRLIDLMYEGLDYARIGGENDTTIMGLVFLQDIEKTLAILQNYNLRFAHLLQAVTNMEIDANRIALDNVTSTMIEMVENVVQLVVNTTNILNMVERPNVMEYDPVTGDPTGNVAIYLDQADAILNTVMTSLTPIREGLLLLRDDTTSPAEVRAILTGGPMQIGDDPVFELDASGDRVPLTSHPDYPFTSTDPTDPSYRGNEPATVDGYILWEQEYDPIGLFGRCQDILRHTREAIELVNIEVNLCNLLDARYKLPDTANKIRTLLIDEVIPTTPVMNVNDVRTRITTSQGRLLDYRQNTFRNLLQNFDGTIQLMFGTDGEIEVGAPNRTARINSLLARGYRGMIDEGLTDTKMFPIDMVLDANYDVSVKNAIVTLCTQIRGDFMGILDTGFRATAEQARDFRRTRLQVSNFRVAIFTQDFIVKDVEYTGTNIRVTSTFFLASKIPNNDNLHGIQWNFVGPRRGTISGFESMSFNPNAQWRENLYRAQINYVEQDPYRVRFNSQLTSQNMVSALSNIAAVRVLLRIQRDVERLMEDYQFEFNDPITRGAAQLNLNGYLAQWIANRACTSISGEVYASDYDRRQKLLRVRIDMIFNTVIERVHIDLVVNG